MCTFQERIRGFQTLTQAVEKLVCKTAYVWHDVYLLNGILYSFLCSQIFKFWHIFKLLHTGTLWTCHWFWFPI